MSARDDPRSTFIRVSVVPSMRIPRGRGPSRPWRGPGSRPRPVRRPRARPLESSQTAIRSPRRSRTAVRRCFRSRTKSLRALQQRRDCQKATGTAPGRDGPHWAQASEHRRRPRGRGDCRGTRGARAAPQGRSRLKDGLPPGWGPEENPRAPALRPHRAGSVLVEPGTTGNIPPSLVRGIFNNGLRAGRWGKPTASMRVSALQLRALAPATSAKLYRPRRRCFSADS